MIFPKQTKRIGTCLAILIPSRIRIKKPHDIIPEKTIMKRPGSILYNGKSWIPARLSYHLNVVAIKRILPNGKKAKRGLICHSCNNDWCVNFNHLYLGTRKNNQDDFYATEAGAKRKLELKTNSALITRSKESVEASAKWHTGRKRSKLTCERIRNSQIGKVLSEEHKMSIGIGSKNAWDKRRGML